MKLVVSCVMFGLEEAAQWYNFNAIWFELTL